MIFLFSRKKSRKDTIEQIKEEPNLQRNLKLYLTPFNTIFFSSIVVGSLLLIQVGFVMWNDMTVWGKDFSSILFGSRTGESISLGIGLQIIHYYLIGILFLFSAIILFVLKRSNIKKKTWFKQVNICFHICKTDIIHWQYHHLFSLVNSEIPFFWMVSRFFR